MKFKLDENRPVELAESLGKAGLDAVTVVAQDLGGRPDRDIISVCRNEDRALITLDVGFADIRLYPPESYPGLIVLRLARQDTPHVLALAAQLPRASATRGHRRLSVDRRRASSSNPQLGAA